MLRDEHVRCGGRIRETGRPKGLHRALIRPYSLLGNPGGMLGVLKSHDEGGPTMDAAYDGRQVVGIDLHRHRSVLLRMTESGERLGSVRIENDPMALAAEISKAGEHPQVVLEATYGWVRHEGA